MICIGFDTSNYTTSCAAFDGQRGEMFSRLLDVRPGELGLRQSEALLSHVKRLPELSDRLFACIRTGEIGAVAVSTRPRAVEGSYMPCFLAGESQARVLASALRVPLVEVSHQQGHIAAVLWSADRMDLLGGRFLAWHLSGGTTELLLVDSSDGTVRCEKLGGTTDISAGQLIDRTGQMLGLDFPAGKALDALAAETAGERDCFPVKVKGFEFSFSGLENKVREFRDAHPDQPGKTAAYALRSVCRAVRQATRNARREYPLPVLFSGGVASNSMLRSVMADLDPVFGTPACSTDNALGVAVLGWLRLSGWREQT